MRVLVLGGTGLISTAIVERLIEKGHVPVLFNRGITSRRFGHAVECITGNREDFADFKKKIGKISFDAVIDMITFDAKTAANAVKVFSGRAEHYLFCSTVCVYGPLSAVPAGESEPVTPISGYGRGKSAAEAVFKKAFEKDDFPLTMFRPSHCYGPGAPLLDIWGYNPCLVNRIRRGRPILVPGDGIGLWQPGYVGDVAKGFVGALGRPATFGHAYNIVGDEVMEWRVFHERMARAIGHEAKIVTMTTQQIIAGAPKQASGMLEEIFQYHGAYTNAALKRDVPDFKDLLPWEEGVRRTVAWMDEARVHRPLSDQAWLDELIKRGRDFERELKRKH